MNPVTLRSLSDCLLLLVDDEPANLDLLEEFLHRDGYRGFRRAHNGCEALARFDEHAPDIVLLDLHMPQHNGFDVLRDLQDRIEPGDFVPILVLTADASPKARARALSEGAHDFLIKPLDALEVRLRVRNLLRTRLLHSEQRHATYTREHVLSVVAHDLRNPLASITMDAEMLRNLLSAEEHPIQAQAVSRIERASARMQKLIDDLLEVSRLQHGTFAIRAVPVAPDTVLADALALLQPLARSRRIGLSFDGPAGLPHIQVDADRILQVFSNLVGNALKFTPAGGDVRVSWQKRAGELIVTVADSGPGMSEQQLAQVFNPFWQAREEDGRRGLGLGLVITRAIIEAHGGRIWIESAPRRGTTAYFVLPFVTSPAAPAAAPRPVEVLP